MKAEWERVVAHLYLAKRAAQKAIAQVDLGLEVICDGQREDVSLAIVEDAQARLVEAQNLLQELMETSRRQEKGTSI